MGVDFTTHYASYINHGKREGFQAARKRLSEWLSTAEALDVAEAAYAEHGSLGDVLAALAEAAPNGAFLPYRQGSK